MIVFPHQGIDRFRFGMSRAEIEQAAGVPPVRFKSSEFALSEEDLGVDLPLDYVDFLRASNGAEGPVGRSYLEVWPAEDVLRLNEEYRAKEFLPGLMLFGSSLGGVAYGFDGRGDKATIAEVPFDSMNPESVIRRGSSLQELLEFLVMQWPEG